MNNNNVEMAAFHPEGVLCLEWEGTCKREAPDQIGEELQVVTGEAELEGLKDKGSEGESDEGEEDNPFDPTVNLNFEVDEEGNVVWPTATDTSSDGSVLVSLLLSLSSVFTLLLPRTWSRTTTVVGATCTRRM